MSNKQAPVDGNIQTFLRIRPSKKPSGYFNPNELDPDTLTFTLPDNFKSDYINNSKLHHEFHFNGILPMNCTQEDVFKKVGAAAVNNALEGFNSTIFAYGQTGSGKTFTITGGPDSYADRGIIPRAINTIFKEFRSKSDVQLKAYISYLEIYNEQGYDLLQDKKNLVSLDDLPKVHLLEDEYGNFHLKDLSMHAADTEEDALNLLFLGDTNRAIAVTTMNSVSSRSHCIFTIALEVRTLGTDTVRRSKLHLVDLAGSERVAKTNSSGSTLTEAKYINTSLFFLEMVIVALYEKATKGRQHIPYRNSLMTSVLRDSLGGNCKTIMVATINPEASHTEESLSTCRFAQRVSMIKNKAVLNEDLDPSLVIRRLKDEILSLREEISYLKGEAGEGEVPSPQELADLQQKCRTYCDDPAPTAVLNVGTLTLTKIKDAFAIFKNLVLESRASGGGSGFGGGGGGGGPESEDLLKQIRDLKSLLVQRDTEIAILVNMVKKSKGNESAISSSESPSSGYSAGNNGRERGKEWGYEGNNGGMTSQISPRVSSSQGGRRSSESKGGGGGHHSSLVPSSTNMNQQNHISASASMARVPPDRLAVKEEKLIKKYLFGVPPPDSIKILDDPAEAFEYFRVRVDSHAAIEENKEILRVKYAEAKTLGERANNSRNTINYLKNSIESIRRERAIQGLDVKSGDGENGLDSETEEEQTYRRAIEQEKEVYKESFEKLKQVKPEIEHIRKILEKSRSNLQNQFDQWYNNLTTKMTVTEKSKAGGTSSSSYERPPNGSNVYGENVSSRSIPSSGKESGDLFPARKAWGTPEASPSDETKEKSSLVHSDRRGVSQSMDSFPNENRNGSSVNSLSSSNLSHAANNALPPLTGNKEADDDIMAFYKAKEELLKRRAQQSTNIPNKSLPFVNDK